MMYSRLFSLAVLLIPFGAIAQKTTTPAPVTTTPTRPTTPTVPTPTQPTQPTATSTEFPRPIYISGKVTLEDGTPPPDFVRIEKVCNGNPRPQGFTDSKGRFSFQLDNAMNIMSDASDSSFTRTGSSPGMSSGSGSLDSFSRSTSLMGCEIRASLAGFRSDSVNLGSHDSFDNPNVGTLVLHRMGNVEGTTISMTSLNAPKEAQKNFQKGRDAIKKQKKEEAEKFFQKAVDEYPKYATAWYELGRLQLAMNKIADAEKSFQNSIAADPKLVSPYLDLTLIAAKAGDWPKTLETSSRVIKLNPVDFPYAYFYNAVANLNLQNVDAAEKSALEAQKLDTRRQIAQIPRLLTTIQSAKTKIAADERR